MKNKRIAIFVSLFAAIALIPFLWTLDADACFSLAAGKKTTVDGAVLFGHNEDDGGTLVTRLHLIPRQLHEPGEVIEMWDTGTIIPQVEETYAFIWSEMPNFSFSDSYLNEWGVAIASDASGSKETSPYDLTQGGIAYWLRRLVPERARTAREGVLIMGEAIENYGYASSGRTYTVSDPTETWLVAVVAGRHWVAQRVPEKEVAVLSNRYNIRQVDLSDTDNFLASPDLIDYAIAQGWYDPDAGEPFDFGQAYGRPSSQTSESNTIRQWMGIFLLTGDSYPLDDLPFSVKPNRKLAVSDIIHILRSHYEGTQYDQTTDEVLDQFGDPHHTPVRVICTASTQESFVMQQRDHMPTFIGNIYWRTQGRPCEGVYVPWYLGILEIPTPYAVGEPARYNSPLEDRYYDPDSAYWVYNRMNTLVDMDYRVKQPLVRNIWDDFEATEFELQKEAEKTANKLYRGDKGEGGDEYLAKWFLTRYTESLALNVYYKALYFIDQFSD